MFYTFTIVWSEFDRHDRLVTKCKRFATDNAMGKFRKRLEKKSNFKELSIYYTPSEFD